MPAAPSARARQISASSLFNQMALFAKRKCARVCVVKIAGASHVAPLRSQTCRPNVSCRQLDGRRCEHGSVAILSPGLLCLPHTSPLVFAVCFALGAESLAGVGGVGRACHDCAPSAAIPTEISVWAELKSRAHKGGGNGRNSERREALLANWDPEITQPFATTHIH